MNVLESKKDTELIDIVMNCELDFDIRKHAAKELLNRAREEETQDNGGDRKEVI